MLYQFVCMEAHEELENTVGFLLLCFWGIAGNKVKTVVISLSSQGASFFLA